MGAISIRDLVKRYGSGAKANQVIPGVNAEIAIKLFGDALCVRGFLGLGSKETLRFSRSEPDFDVFAPEERWYQRR